jgi:hypothetical protein
MTESLHCFERRVELHAAHNVVNDVESLVLRMFGDVVLDCLSLAIDRHRSQARNVLEALGASVAKTFAPNAFEI